MRDCTQMNSRVNSPVRPGRVTPSWASDRSTAKRSRPGCRGTCSARRGPCRVNSTDAATSSARLGRTPGSGGREVILSLRPWAAARACPASAAIGSSGGQPGRQRHDADDAAGRRRPRPPYARPSSARGARPARRRARGGPRRAPSGRRRPVTGARRPARSSRAARSAAASTLHAGPVQPAGDVVHHPARPAPGRRCRRRPAPRRRPCRRAASAPAPRGVARRRDGSARGGHGVRSGRGSTAPRRVRAPGGRRMGSAGARRSARMSAAHGRIGAHAERARRVGRPAEAREEHRDADRGDRGRPLALLRARRPDAVRRRLRPPDAPARGARGGVPRAAHARLADPEGRRRGLDRVHRRRPPRADGEPRQRVLLRGARRVARPAGPRRRRRTRRCSASSRSTGSRSTCSTRAAGWSARADPRRRPHRRGRHPQRPHHRLVPAPADRHRRSSRCPRCVEVRGEVFLPVEAFERLNESMPDAGKPVVRQPAQRRRRVAAAEGPPGHRDPRRSAWSATASGPARASTPTVAVARPTTRSQAWGLPVSRPGPGAARR